MSPDAKTIVFDLLGDLYRLPISGGKAITRVDTSAGYPQRIELNRGEIFLISRLKITPLVAAGQPVEGVQPTHYLQSLVARA